MVERFVCVKSDHLVRILLLISARASFNPFGLCVSSVPSTDKTLGRRCMVREEIPNKDGKPSLKDLSRPETGDSVGKSDSVGDRHRLIKEVDGGPSQPL